MQQSIDLGNHDPAVVLALATLYAQVARTDDGLRLLDLVPESTGDRRLDAERVHILGNLLSRSPSGGLEEFDEAYRQWAEVGDVEKQGWARSNKGVALFTLGRVREAETAMFEGAELFESIGAREGTAATYGFLALIRPTDPPRARLAARCAAVR